MLSKWSCSYHASSPDLPCDSQPFELESETSKVPGEAVRGRALALPWRGGRAYLTQPETLLCHSHAPPSSPAEMSCCQQRNGDCRRPELHQLGFQRSPECLPLPGSCPMHLPIVHTHRSPSSKEKQGLLWGGGNKVTWVLGGRPLSHGA